MTPREEFSHYVIISLVIGLVLWALTETYPRLYVILVAILLFIWHRINLPNRDK